MILEEKQETTWSSGSYCSWLSVRTRVDILPNI